MILHHQPFDYDRPDDPVLELVAVESSAEHALGLEHQKKVAVYTVHDGGAIPRQYRFKANGEALLDPELLERRYIAERDWGANLVAEKLAAALGLECYARVTLARVVLDFNRFPGSTPPVVVSDSLEKQAISHPYSEILDHDRKNGAARALL